MNRTDHHSSIFASGSRYLAVAVIASLILVAALRQEARAEFRPKVAVVLCEDSYAADTYTSHSSSQALVGLAGLVGVPYRTLTLSELLADPSPDYTSVWFSYCTRVAEAQIAPLTTLLSAHLDAGGSLFFDGPLGRYDPAGIYRGMANAMPFLGIDDDGGAAVEGYAIQTTGSTHPIAARAGYPAGLQLTQGVRSDMEIFGFIDPDDPGSEVLLELVAPNAVDSHPYLVVAEPVPGAKVVAVGAYGTYHAPASPFVHDPPIGFHDNQLVPYLVEALLWAIGPADEPFVGLQLSHAPVTAIGRLDGDWSGVLEATQSTFDYLIELAKKTGVATVYGIVSAFAGDADNWASFRTYGPEIERLGGSIGTHSHTHPFQMSAELDAAGWVTEVADSLQLIRDTLGDQSWTPAANTFINPGGGIVLLDYGNFFADVELYMTHGFEQLTPYSSGVMGFGLPDGVAPRPVVNNTPVPDFIWLFVDEFIYSVDQAAMGQANILDYYQNTVGRGVLYNQMWHDYAISDLDLDRHDLSSPIAPLFDVNGDHFATSRIYAPSVPELTGKMHIAHGAGLSSVMSGQDLVATLDYSTLSAAHSAHVAGMGLRVNGGDQPISSVTIDGAAHHGFTADTVILPAADQDSHTVVIGFGETPEAEIRLTHISKPFEELEVAQQELKVWLADPGLASNFCFAMAPSTVVLHADTYQRTGEAESCGQVAFDSSTQLVTAKTFDTGDRFFVTGTERALQDASIAGDVVTLELAPGSEAPVFLQASAAPRQVLVAGEEVAVTLDSGRFSVTVPQSSDSIAIEVRLSRDDPIPPIDCASPVQADNPACAPEPSGCGCKVAPRSSSRHLYVLALFALLVIPLRRRRR